MKSAASRTVAALGSWLTARESVKLRAPPSQRRQCPPVPADAGWATRVTVVSIDRLPRDPFLRTPLVRLHLVDAASGHFLAMEAGAEDEAARVTTVGAGGSRTDRQAEQLAVLPPTAALPPQRPPDDGEDVRPSVGDGATGVVFNSDMLLPVSHRWLLDQNVLLLFEVVDPVSRGPGTHSTADGLHRSAWAFLHAARLRDAPEEGIRLQLYSAPPLNQPSIAAQARALRLRWDASDQAAVVSDLFVGYLSDWRHRVDGCVLVRVAEEDARSLTDVSLRAWAPLEREVQPLGPDALEDARRADKSPDRAAVQRSAEVRHARRSIVLPPSKPLGGRLTVAEQRALRRLRAPSEPCVVPYRLAGRVWLGGTCSALAFSHGGVLLAAAFQASEGDHPIAMVGSDSGAVRALLQGHTDLVHGLCWSADDRRLVSASADGTARVWTVADVEDGAGLGTTPPVTIAVLHHSPPTFVYCACFVDREGSAVVTGAMDGEVRVWDADARVGDRRGGGGAGGGGGGGLGRECGRLPVHGIEPGTRVTSCAFYADKERLVAGTSAGLLLLWRVPGNPLSPADYSLLRHVGDSGSDPLLGHGVTALSLHQQRRILFLAARGNVARVYQLERANLVRHRLAGLACSEHRAPCTLSPDGGFALAGSEDGRVCVWSTRTGNKGNQWLWSVKLGGPVNAVAWHPREHLVVAAAAGSPLVFFDAFVGHSVPTEVGSDGAGAAALVEHS